MSVLDRFEKSVEGAVNGVFAKFGSKDLKPVDLSSALEREIDKEAMPVTRDRTVAPNEYRFKLSTPDFNNIVEWGAETLANELADNLTQYAKSQNYAFVGPVVVIFEEDLELSKGDYRLSSESVQGNTVPVTTDAQTEDCPMLEIGEHQYLLTEEKTIIGRGSDCDIVIDDPGISRRHMEIDVTDNGNTVIARDLNSTNGMYVEGHHVEAATLLDGNTITIGRAARNVSGTVVMYADDITEAMRKAIDETNRRRDIQIAYNKEHGIDPKPLIKKISDVNDMLAKEDVDTQTLLGTGYRNADKAGNSHLGVPHTSKEESGRRHEEILKAGLPAQDLADLIRQLSEQMHTAAEQLQFELAARLRDEIRDLKKELRQMTEASK